MSSSGAREREVLLVHDDPAVNHPAASLSGKPSGRLSDGERMDRCVQDAGAPRGESQMVVPDDERQPTVTSDRRARRGARGSRVRAEVWHARV